MRKLTARLLLLTGACGCDGPRAGACSTLLTDLSRRRRGVEPPREGADALPGVDFQHLRPAPPALEGVAPGELVAIPAGPFLMGSDETPDEAPRRTVQLPAFEIERTEVTVGQFMAFARAGYPDQRWWSADGWAWKTRYNVQPPRVEVPDSHPMTWVSYYEAEAYARWAGRRLPTEAEWEKAARGTDGRTWPWGDVADAARSNHWVYKIPPLPLRTLSWPAASGLEGQSPYGILHMAGNVWEWTSSAYPSDRAGRSGAVSGDTAGTTASGDTAATPTSGAAAGNTAAPASSSVALRWRAIRGGAWTTLLSQQRTSTREPARPDERRPNLGFRCVRDPGTGGRP